ncbi:hypothetical protein RND81_02G215300 [Saponaria officinalis]|uniref:Uncharacterized protein n=1 Tax=Saponaria officinalis TaxID=3572 RepID=A0AAW1MWB3_SAPOF
MFLYMLYVCCFTPLFVSSKFFRDHIPSTVVFQPQSCTMTLLDVETLWVYIDNKQAIHPLVFAIFFMAIVPPSNKGGLIGRTHMWVQGMVQKTTGKRVETKSPSVSAAVNHDPHE